MTPVQRDILRAMAVWRERRWHGRSEEEHRRWFGEALRSRYPSWKWSNDLPGSYCDCLVAGSIILKFDRLGDDGATAREWRIWRRATPYKRRFLARCLRYEDGLLFQSRVAVCGKKCWIAQWYAWRFRILDWESNHGHRKSGAPVFFDYDNLGWDGRRGRTLTYLAQGVQ